MFLIMSGCSPSTSLPGSCTSQASTCRGRVHAWLLLACRPCSADWVCLARMFYTQQSGKQTLAIIYFVPVSAGVTRLFTKICSRSGGGKGTRGSALINRLAKLAESSGLLHVFGGGIVDQVHPALPRNGCTDTLPLCCMGLTMPWSASFLK